MSSSMHQIISARQLLLFSLHSFMVCTIIPVCRASVTKNPDQALDPGELGTGIKCGSCPCVNPCSQLVPPPPPLPPPPPPPPPQTLYVTPLAPPPPRFIYVTSVPASLSETDPYDHWKFYSGARQNAVSWLLLLVGLGIPELLVIW
uniref:4Fe-4S ferredoxin-type domain-containing protein n=1 Tax=Salix viminalis TaxID=40686 RepID=A0A6N2LF86_SALVM